MKRTIIAFVVILVAIACASRKQQLVKYKTLDFNEKIPLAENDPDSIHYSIELHFTELIDYPNKKSLKQVKKQLNAHFFELPSPTLQPEENVKAMIASIAPNYRKEVSGLKEQYGDMSYMLNYILIKSLNIIYNKKALLSFELETYIYTGGAHGLGDKSYLHFDMKTGKQFSLKELFYDGGKEALDELLLQRCEEMKQQEEDYPLFNDAIPKAIENFYFDEKKIYFVYNPYEVAPYSAGYVIIDIELEKAKQWVDRKGPLEFVR